MPEPEAPAFFFAISSERLSAAVFALRQNGGLQPLP